VVLVSHRRYDDEVDYEMSCARFGNEFLKIARRLELLIGSGDKLFYHILSCV